MSRWAESVEALCGLFGLSGITLNAKGCVALQLESGRRVAFETKQDELLVYASEPVPYDWSERLMKAWARSHFMQLRGGRPVQAALREQSGITRLLVVARMHPREHSPQDLRAAVEYLLRWLDATRSN